ncbi:hypothetical protein [uncultured Maritimibacter sp.]|uniref:hypothetical protein n=1 Tax=uncultured Maritimibacter sp. TaxID=991866 RepID=UPI002630BA89|nr:hypothetical protein [uncultured Maritimibacter sp.]
MNTPLASIAITLVLTTAAQADQLRCVYRAGGEDLPWAAELHYFGEAGEPPRYEQILLRSETYDVRLIGSQWAAEAQAPDGLRLAQVQSTAQVLDGVGAYGVEVLVSPIVPEGADPDVPRRLWGKLIVDGRTIMSAPMEPVTFPIGTFLSMHTGYNAAYDQIEDFGSDTEATVDYGQVVRAKTIVRFALFETTTEDEAAEPPADQGSLAQFSFDVTNFTAPVAALNDLLAEHETLIMADCPDHGM